MLSDRRHPPPWETLETEADRTYNSAYRFAHPLRNSQVLQTHAADPSDLLHSPGEDPVVPIDHDISARAQTVASLADYLSELALNPDLSQTTIQKYTHNLRKFADWLAGSPISTRTARAFLAHLREHGYSHSTVVSYYHALKPFLEFLGMPLKVRFRKPRRLPQYHSPDHVAAIIQGINTRTDTWAKLAERDSLIIMTLAFTGLRRAELLGLRPCDIAGSKLLVRRGKGDKDRVVSLVAPLAEALAAYIHTHNLRPTDRIFPIQPKRLYTIVKQAALRAGISDISPHSLRHYFATRLVEGGAPLKAVQELLGHADMSTTAVYLDIVASHLDAAVDILCPEVQSLSLSVDLNNKHKRIENRSRSLSLSLSNEQKQRKGDACRGLRSARESASTPPLTSHPSRPSSNTGQGSEASCAWGRDAPIASPATPSAGDTRPALSSTKPPRSGSSGTRSSATSRPSPTIPTGATSPSPGLARDGAPDTTSPAGSGKKRRAPRAMRKLLPARQSR